MGFYEVIVAGAGPAGATAAYILCKLGYRVLLIDKARFPRPKVCAGALTYKTHKLIMRIFELSSEEIQELVSVSSNAFEVYYKDRRILSGEYKRPFYFVDRKMYDNFFVNKARTCGVEVIEKDRIVDYNPYTNEVTLSSAKKFKGRYIIGADGVNSIIRKRLPVYEAEEWKKSLALGMEVYVDKQLVKKPRMYLGYINPGYGWAFPGRNNTIVGLGGILRNKHHFAEKFRRFLNNLNLRAEGFVGHLIPYGNFLKEPIYRATLLTGDAAGFVDPLFGEGIFFCTQERRNSSF